MDLCTNCKVEDLLKEHAEVRPWSVINYFLVMMYGLIKVDFPHESKSFDRQVVANFRKECEEIEDQRFSIPKDLTKIKFLAEYQ